MGNSLLVPVIPNILDAFDRSDSSAGLLVAASSLPGIAVAPIIGILADRLGRRAVLVPCLAVFGIAGVLTAIAPTFELMLLARFLMGFGGAGLVNLAIVLIGDNFEGSSRTHWIGINAGILTAALAIFPLIGGLIAEVGGWRWSLAPYSLGVFAAGAAWVILDRGRPANPPALGAQLRGAVRALRHPVVTWSVTGGAIVFAVIFGVFLTAMPGHLENDFGLGAGARGIVIGIPAISSSMAAFSLGRVRRRWSAGMVLVGSATLWVVAFLIIGTATILPLLIVGTLIYGLGEGAMLPTMQDAAIGTSPDEHRASVMATWTAFARLGQTVGPLLTALVLSGWGTQAALYGGAVGASLLLAVYVFSPLRQHR